MNVKAPYLTLDEARTIIATDGAAWETSEHQAIANREGWNIFNLWVNVRRGPDEMTDAGMEVYDDPEEWGGCTDPIDFFGTDGELTEHCQKRAAEGSEAHATALKIEHALNSLRFHLWGEEWVDSRLGPGVRISAA